MCIVYTCITSLVFGIDVMRTFFEIFNVNNFLTLFNKFVLEQVYDWRGMTSVPLLQNCYRESECKKISFVLCASIRRGVDHEIQRKQENGGE